MMRCKFTRYFTSFVFVLLASSFFFSWSSFSLADSNKSSIRISPVTFQYKIGQGETENDFVTVTNPNQDLLEITLEKEDFVAEGEEGATKFLPSGSEKYSLSQWITFSEDQYILKPQESKKINFQISLPKDAEPGGHYAAIFAKTKPQTADGTTQIGVSSRVGSLILVTVLGQTKASGEVVAFSSSQQLYNKGPIAFSARFKNSGTVHFQTGGNIKIFKTSGKEIAKIDLPEHIVMPESIRLYGGEWSAGYLFGKYRAELEIIDGDGNSQKAETTFWVIPWIEISIALLAVLTLIALLIIIKKKFKIVKK